MPALRTAEERFLDLPGYAYAPHHAQDLAGFAGLRMHIARRALTAFGNGCMDVCKVAVSWNKKTSDVGDK